MKNSSKVLSLVGLATRAGKTVMVSSSTEKSVQKQEKAFLFSWPWKTRPENTRKKFRDMCDFYEVPVYVFGDKEELGKYCGKEFRASLAVQDENFAKAIMKELEKSHRA